MATLNTAQQLRATWSSNTTASRATTTHISALMANAEAECAKHLRDSELDADQYLFDDWSVLVVLDDRVATFNNAGDAQDWIKANNKVDPKPAAKPAAPTMSELTKLGMLRELILTKQAYEHAYREFVTGIGRGARKPLNTEQVRILETTVARAAECGMARDIDLEELTELLNAIGA